MKDKSATNSFHDAEDFALPTENEDRASELRLTYALVVGFVFRRSAIGKFIAVYTCNIE
jgi:hypothetical protein